jgi:hypothetical protein
MFAKTITGKGFGGTIDYAFYGKKENVQRDENGKKISRGEVIGGTVSGTTRRELMNDFQAVKDLKPDKMKPMAHHILAFSPEDEPHLTNERMNEIAASYMEKKGYSEKAVYVVIKHEDTDNKHLHIIAATTETDGRGIFLARTKDKDLSQQLERENNLREVERPESQSKNEKPPKFNELQMIERTGEPSAKQKLQESIKTALKESKTTTEFLAHLKESGTNARFNVQRTGRVSGISFETDGVIFKGSSLGKDFSWNGLQKQGLSYEPERDFKAVEAANTKSPLTDNPSDATETASFLVGKLNEARIQTENRSLPKDFQETLKNAFVEAAKREPSGTQINSVKEAAQKLGVEAPNFKTSLEATAYLVMNRTPEQLNETIKKFEEHYKEHQPERETVKDRPRRYLSR